MTTSLHESFLQLVRLGIGHGPVNGSGLSVHGSIDWVALKALAERQGLSAVILDALNTDGTNLTDSMPVQMKLEWIGEVLQNYEARYRQYEKAIRTLAGFYNSRVFRMMVLKGYASSLDWPKPEHRPCGDIDIWLFGQQREADAALGSWFKVQGSSSTIDSSHHHHTVFEWNGFTVENHYDFVNVHAHRSSAELEKVFKELGKDDSHSVDVLGETVYLPSPNLHALFLIKHMVSHFAAAEISLKQVLDWAFFAGKHGKEVDWQWLQNMLEKYHMIEFYNTINAISVGDLGFDAKYFSNVQFRPDLKDKVLNDILYPKYSANEPSHLIPRLLYKYRRWQGNAWKQKLCYSESRWSAFWSGVWSHLLKPKSI